MFVACGIWCLADVSSVSPSSEQTVCSDEGLTLETSAKHHIPQLTGKPDILIGRNETKRVLFEMQKTIWIHAFRLMSLISYFWRADS